MSFAHLHAEGYIGNLRSIPGTQFVGFSDTDAERGQHFAQVFDATCYNTHEALLAEGLDAVLICSENANHRQLVEMAAEAGVHVLCEKPIEVTLADAEAMRDVCERHNVKFMTAFPMRFAPEAQQVKATLDRGDLGQVYAVNGINHSKIPREHRAWFAQKALAGGGAVMDHTVHLTDIYRWFFGCDVVSVYAEIDNLFYPGEVDVDTAGIVTLEMANGVFATIDCSWSRPLSYPRWGHFKLDIVGSDGFVTLDNLAQYLTLYSPQTPQHPTWLNYGPDPNQAMINEFVAAIREDRTPAVTWRDGYEALRVALACFESAQRHDVVRLGA